MIKIFFFSCMTDGFGKTSKFISFLYFTYQEREREREREERRAFIFKRFFVKEINCWRCVCVCCSSDDDVDASFSGGVFFLVYSFKGKKE